MDMLSNLQKEDEFKKEEVKNFLRKLGLESAQLVPATIITINKKTKTQGIYLLKKDEEQLTTKNSWMAHVVDSNGVTPIRLGKINKKIGVVIDSGKDAGFEFNDSERKPFIKSAFLALNGMRFLGELSHEGSETELYIATKYEVDPNDPNRFVYGVIQSSRERKVSICASLAKQMTK